MSYIFKLLCVLIIAGLSSCSAFYNRHYTRGFYHETFAKKPSTDPLPKALKEKPFSKTTTKDTIEKRRVIEIEVSGQADNSWKQLIQRKPFQKTEKPLRLKNTKPFKESIIRIKKSHQKTAPSGISGDSSLGQALLYLLAIILALGIVALAIYFLPAILIPAPVASAFVTLVIIAAIIVLVLLVFLVYSMIMLLLDLFRHRKTSAEDEF